MPKVVLAVVAHNNKVLMVCKKLIEGGLTWQFPGGTVEPGESEAEAAAREVIEETGVICRPLRKLGERVHPASRQAISYFLCEFIRGKATLMEPDKFEQVAWLIPPEVFDRVDVAALFEPVKAYLKNLS
jgi:8-oxo-dGTP diphosphatase